MKSQIARLVVVALLLTAGANACAEPSKISRKADQMTMGDVWFECCEPERACAQPCVLVCRKKTHPMVLWCRRKCDSVRGIFWKNKNNDCCECGMPY